MAPFEGADKLAHVGATGAVGLEFIKVLENRKFPIKELTLLASKRSVGKFLTYCGREIAVKELTVDSFKDIDFALFSAGGERSKEFAKAAVAAGAIVIDNSSAFRMDPEVPLVVPEINPQDAFKHKGIIANPNCTTIIMGVALWPIHQVNPIKRITVSTYQAVSGAGAAGLFELQSQQKDFVEGREPKADVFSHVIVNNVFSHNSDMADNGYNQEELKMVFETKKIFGNPQIAINPTCIRVPIERAHSESIHLELTNPISKDQVTALLKKASGVKIVDDLQKNHFPMPLEATGKDEVLVGRIRSDIEDPRRISLFVCGDQLLKGAALNAVQIAELFVKRNA